MEEISKLSIELESIETNFERLIINEIRTTKSRIESILWIIKNWLLKNAVENWLSDDSWQVTKMKWTCENLLSKIEKIEVKAENNPNENLKISA